MVIEVVVCKFFLARSKNEVRLLHDIQFWFAIYYLPIFSYDEVSLCRISTSLHLMVDVSIR